ncbi:unnamed protein product [Caenorhabditis angaria]|uniref:Uncharacterized protein n=1 Tax=Caenorhabditis angaria TaxID=860376 RepID=A0A9P1IZT0_9PELO|nr:unnamed protein product [Caenorhabditis angaria]
MKVLYQVFEELPQVRQFEKDMYSDVLNTALFLTQKFIDVPQHAGVLCNGSYISTGQLHQEVNILRIAMDRINQVIQSRKQLNIYNNSNV